MTIQTVDAWIADSTSQIARLVRERQYYHLTRKDGIEYQYAIAIVIPGFYDVSSDHAERHTVLQSILEYAEAPVSFIGHSTGMTLMFVSFTDALTYKLKNS